MVIALGGSILANQDGWGRSFADMTLILMRSQREAKGTGRILALIDRLNERSPLPILERRWLKRGYITTVTGIIPLGIVLVFKDPVKVMSVSGIIAADHTPLIVIAALFVNKTRLPKALQPGAFITSAMGAAGLFYLGFAVVYVLNLVDLLGS